MGSGASLHGSNPERSMSALGQKQTFERLRLMSALPPKADMDQHGRDVRFVPKADSRGATKTSLFDHFIGGREELRGDCKADCVGGLDIDGQCEFAHLLYR